MKMDKRTRFAPLRLKIALGFAFFSVLAVGSTTYFYYQSARAQLWQDIRARLLDSVSIAALQVDAEAHSQLTDPSQEGGPIYLQLKKTLQNIRDAGTDIEFVYTMRPDAHGNIMFVVDAEESEEDISHLGDLYPDSGPTLAENFLTMSQPMLEEEIYTDEWGAHLSGYAPFYAGDGRREGVLGMDISANDIVALERQILLRSLLIFIGSTVTLTVMGWFLGAALTASISRLTRSAERFASGDLAHRVRVKTNDEVEILADAFNATAEKLSELVAGLEQRVEERAAALTRRTSQLQAAAQVARQAAEIKEPSALLNEAARLISRQFGFYHAGLFLLDENREYAVLQAASSEGGQRMLARGHRLRVGGQGIVGFAVAQKRPRIALDTGTDAVYFDNPDLPQTRSEAALPLIVGGNVIGALDIQSEEPQAFTAEDIETFQTLASQLALAIENARLFREMQAAVQQLEQTASRSATQAWKGIARAREIAFQYTPLGIRPLEKHRAPDTAEKLTIPIALRNRKIGEIKIKRKDGPAGWDPREKTMLEEIAGQVALALENARLLEDAQQRAQRERVISEIAARIGSAHDADAILRVTAQEIGKALGDSEVAIQIRGLEAEGQ